MPLETIHQVILEIQCAPHVITGAGEIDRSRYHVARGKTRAGVLNLAYATNQQRRAHQQYKAQRHLHQNQPRAHVRFAASADYSS